MTLTPKQRRFVEEYLIDLCGTKAAMRAGYSPKSATKIAYQLLANTTVADEVKRIQAERSEALKLDSESVLKEISAIAFGGIEDLFGEEPSYQSFVRQFQSQKINTVQQIRIGPDGAISIKLYDKLRALELLGKHLGLFIGKADPERKKSKEEIFERVRLYLKRRIEKDADIQNNVAPHKD